MGFLKIFNFSTTEQQLLVQMSYRPVDFNGFFDALSNS